MKPLSSMHCFPIGAVMALGLTIGSSACVFASEPFRVDAAIVLAVDSSSSIDVEQANLQRYGHSDAFRSHELQQVIRRGPIGCIAITYVEWASVGMLRTVVPWKQICSSRDALDAASLIAEKGDTGTGRRGRTSLSYALEVSSLLLDNFPGFAGSKIIDISSNGTNNDGVPVEQARANVLAKGHTINAIAVARTEPGVADNLWDYLERNVIGGPGAFAITPEKPGDYLDAIKRKLVIEVSRAGSSQRHGRAAGISTEVAAAAIDSPVAPFR